MRQYPEKRVPCVHAYRTHVRTVRVKQDTSRIFFEREIDMLTLMSRKIDR